MKQLKEKTICQKARLIEGDRVRIIDCEMSGIPSKYRRTIATLYDDNGTDLPAIQTNDGEYHRVYFRAIEKIIINC